MITVAEKRSPRYKAFQLNFDPGNELINFLLVNDIPFIFDPVGKQTLKVTCNGEIPIIRLVEGDWLLVPEDIYNQGDIEPVKINSSWFFTDVYFNDYYEEILT